MTPPTNWTVETIKEGVVSWTLWPGFVGATCPGCGLKANVLDYGTWQCPDCLVHRRTATTNATLHESPDVGPSRAVVDQAAEESLGRLDPEAP